MGIFNNNYSYTSNTEYVSEGYELIKSFRSNPENVPLYLEEGAYYLATSDLVNYMEAAELSNVEEAINTIAVHNCIENFEIICVDDSEKETGYHHLQESVNEYVAEGVENGAMNLNQAKKYYNKVLSSAKNSKGSKEQLQERIKLLKECVKAMEQEKKRAEDKTTSGQIKYMLKAAIPFNYVWRLVKLGDVYAGLGELASIIINFFLPGAGGVYSLVTRAVTYTKMLQDNIDKTNEAIKFLEDKVKEMK